MDTVQDKLIAGLLAKGERELPSESIKYRVFTAEKFLPSRFHSSRLYVGEKGYIRIGPTRALSFVLKNAIREQILLAGDKNA